MKLVRNSFEGVAFVNTWKIQQNVNDVIQTIDTSQ